MVVLFSSGQVKVGEMAVGAADGIELAATVEDTMSTAVTVVTVARPATVALIV